MLSIGWILLCGGLVLFMQAGFLCLESGLTRSKNNINVAIKNVADLGVSILLFWLIGFGLMYGASQAGWLGTTGFFHKLGSGNPELASFFLFQAVFCGTAVTIVAGAVAERMRFRSYILAAVLISGFLYPIYGHWAWGGTLDGSEGWLRGVGFVDFAGCSVVHGTGGWAALACLLIIGPRQGRFGQDGKARDIPPGNLPLAMLGVIILWLGWLGFNGGSALALNRTVPAILANTILAGAAGTITATLLGRLFQGFWNARATMNGSIAGLVAITAGCHAVDAHASLMIGAVGGIIALIGSRLLETWRIDDVASVIPVHAFAGTWGLISVALLGDKAILGTGLGTVAQLGVQVLGAAVNFTFVFGMAWIAFKLIHRFYPMRITAAEEEEGLNVAEHRAVNEHYNLLTAMARQSRQPDLSLRVPEEPFTETGQIARLYNQILDAWQGEVSRSESIVRDMTDALLTLNPEGKIQSANPALATLFGRQEDEVLGHPINLLFDSQPGDPSLHLPDIQEYLSEPGSDDVYRLELTGCRKDGNTFPAELSLSLKSNPNPHRSEGPESFWVCTIRNITERHGYEKNLLETKQEAEEARDQLNEKFQQVEEFNRYAAGREMRMVALKEEINRLSEELDRPPPYPQDKVESDPAQDNERKTG